MLENHLNTRYNLMKSFTYSDYVDSYYINPDSTLIVFNEMNNSSSYSTIIYFAATKEKIQHILSEADGVALFSWILNW